MAITVKGLGSGLDYQSWITALVGAKQAKIDAISTNVSKIGTQETTLSNLKSNYTSLLASIQTFSNTLALNNVFNQKAATSSSSAVAASVSAYADTQTLKVGVSQLATATTAQSSSAVASKIDGTTLVSSISGGTVKPGTLSIYVDNTKYSIAVNLSNTLGDVLNNITSATGLAASVDAEGKVTIGAGSSSNIVIGSTADTSNVSNVLSLTKNVDGSYTSSKSVFDTDTSVALTSAAFTSGNVTAGTFTIGNAEFTIDGTTTLSSLVKQINDNTNAGVTAFWDSNSGKLALESSNQGASNINIQAGTSNFTDVMGFTTSTWNAADGSMASTELTNNSQTLGTNAILTINGTTITSSSNTVTSDISGITGLTLTLNAETSSNATINVATDTTSAVSAIESFVTSFNSAITSTDSATSLTGNLHGESILDMLRNKIRSTVTSNVTGVEGYQNLASIGITAGKVSTNVSADTTQLVIDSDKLVAALKSNPDAVVKLILGDTASGTEGVFTKMETSLSNSLDPINGYFTTRSNSYESQVARLNKQKASMTDALTKYQTQLETKFAAMDKLISALKNSASVFDSYFNTSSNNKTSSSTTLGG